MNIGLWPVLQPTRTHLVSPLSNQGTGSLPECYQCAQDLLWHGRLP